MTMKDMYDMMKELDTFPEQIKLKTETKSMILDELRDLPLSELALCRHLIKERDHIKKIMIWLDEEE